MPVTQDRRIDAEPTKGFFISMLVKDIELTRAIIDLVDNCLDGAGRVRPSGNYRGLHVKVEATPDHFTIADNCGGIPVELARKYAFRFGRPSGSKSIPHSIGQFGVGMKRALFKLGTEFTVESTTTTSRFLLCVNVDDWKQQPEWQFEFKELEEHVRYPTEQTGTIITVRPLHTSVAENFALESFRTRLAKEIAEAYTQSIAGGLAISLGTVPLESRPLQLLQSANLRPAYVRMSWKSGRSKVAVQLYAGIATSDPAAAGWYVFCNGRLVLPADQENTTGWGEGRGRTIPRFHNQFARFRGYAMFDSDDAGVLPWNTTKTGVDVDSPSFRSVRLKMITMMRPVIDFLNKLDAEKDNEAAGAKPLEAAVKASREVDLANLRARSVFLSPRLRMERRAPDTGRIQYSKPLDEINRIKKQLRVSRFKDVGEKTFEYYLKMECGD